MTSVKGRVYSAYIGAYSCSKFAGEAFSDVLRLEMAKWGVKVAIIEPGNFGGATGCLEVPEIITIISYYIILLYLIILKNQPN